MAETPDQTERAYERFITLADETVWPNPDAANDLGWRLKYAPKSLTPQDMNVVASVLFAYHELCTRPPFGRKLPMLRRAVQAARARREDHRG